MKQTIRQKVLRHLYPVFRKFTSGVQNTKGIEERIITSRKSFYLLQAKRINGDVFEFSQLKGKKILIVNTASDCGYTGQYEALEKLWEMYSDKLEILAFPSNDFKMQEPGTNEEIESFCTVNYGIRFPIMQKSNVLKGAEQHPVFQWLTNDLLNGWNNNNPKWNFTKYLVDEKGNLRSVFAPSIDPLSKDLTGYLSA